MLYGIQIALYLVAAIIVAGVGFLGWALLQLFRETRKHNRMTRLSCEDRWRYRIPPSH